jgi:hypothetical protein
MRHLRQVSQPSLVWPSVRRRYGPAPASDWHLHARIGVNVATRRPSPLPDKPSIAVLPFAMRQ